MGVVKLLGMLIVFLIGINGYIILVKNLIEHRGDL